MIEMDNVFKSNAKKYNVDYIPTQKDKQFMYSTCKKRFVIKNVMDIK
jgi:hypothetical protein